MIHLHNSLKGKSVQWLAAAALWMFSNLLPVSHEGIISSHPTLNLFNSPARSLVSLSFRQNWVHMQYIKGGPIAHTEEGIMIHVGVLLLPWDN